MERASPGIRTVVTTHAASASARLRGGAHLPRQIQHCQAPDEPVTHVHLPPTQAVPRRRREGVVVVVPTFAQRQDAEQEIVAAVVAGPEGPVAPQMADR